MLGDYEVIIAHCVNQKAVGLKGTILIEQANRYVLKVGLIQYLLTNFAQPLVAELREYSYGLHYK